MVCVEIDGTHLAHRVSLSGEKVRRLHAEQETTREPSLRVTSAAWPRWDMSFHFVHQETPLAKHDNKGKHRHPPTHTCTTNGTDDGVAHRHKLFRNPIRVTKVNQDCNNIVNFNLNDLGHARCKVYRSWWSRADSLVRPRYQLVLCPLVHSSVQTRP